MKTTAFYKAGLHTFPINLGTTIKKFFVLQISLFLLTKDKLNIYIQIIVISFRAWENPTTVVLGYEDNWSYLLPLLGY
jgi:hypothetical protein